MGNGCVACCYSSKPQMKAVYAAYAGPKFTDSTVWLCGVPYRNRETSAASSDEEQPHVVEFIRDVNALPYFTYRKDFPAIEHSDYTTDAGWGCMLRTGQMMLANAFLRHYGYREWHRAPFQLVEQRLLPWFEDNPRAHYSIQNIAKFGMVFDKNPGMWFGPSTIANVIKMLIASHPFHSDTLEVIVCMDGCLNVRDLIRKCTEPQTSIPLPKSAAAASAKAADAASAAASPDTRGASRRPTQMRKHSDDEHGGIPMQELYHGRAVSDGIAVAASAVADTVSIREPLPVGVGRSHSPPNDRLDRHGHPLGHGGPRERRRGSTESEPFRAALVIVVVRLGLDTINPIYVPPLLSTFEFPQSLGIIGGRPNASFYFVGVQDNRVFYLDPHVVRPAIDMQAETPIPTEGYHLSGVPPQMPLDRVDPSMALCFYIRNREDLDDFCQRIHAHASGGDPVVTLVDGPAPAPRQHSLHPDADEDDIIVASDSEEDDDEFHEEGGQD